MKTIAFWKLASVLTAVALSLAAAACSGEPEYMGSCMMKMGQTVSCYDFYGEEAKGAAKSQCDYFNRPKEATYSKLLTEKCPGEGKTPKMVKQAEDSDARIEEWSYPSDTKHMAGVAP